MGTGNSLELAQRGNGGGAKEEEMGVPLLDASRRVKTALNLNIKGRVLGL